MIEDGELERLVIAAATGGAERFRGRMIEAINLSFELDPARTEIACARDALMNPAWSTFSAPVKNRCDSMLTDWLWLMSDWSLSGGLFRGRLR